MSEQLSLGAPEPVNNGVDGVVSPLAAEFDRVCEIHGSTVIERIAYSTKRHCLRVWFHNKTCWEYEEVWPGDFAALLAAYSIGQIFNARIRNRFTAKRISEIADKTVPASKAPVYRPPENR